MAGPDDMRWRALSDVLIRAHRARSRHVTRRPTVEEVCERLEDVSLVTDVDRLRELVEFAILECVAANLDDDIAPDALYEELAKVYAQVAEGKGQERHGGEDDLERQDGVKALRRWGIRAAGYQAEKKMRESLRLPAPRDEDERRGAAAYLALWLVTQERGR